MNKSLLFTLLLFPSLLNAKTLKVGKSEQFQDLGTALQIADSGDLLIVTAGIYTTQGATITKPVEIKGDEGAILDGGGQTIMYVNSSNVKIHNITFQNVATNYVEDRAAIKCNNADSLYLYDLKILNCFFGILIENSKYGKIENCRIKGSATTENYIESANGNAIHLWYCKHMKVLNNQVESHRDGIYFEFVEESSISNNVSLRNMRYGLHFMFSHRNEYIQNTFAESGAGVAVMYSSNVTMRQNTFRDNWGTSAYGLLLKDITDSELIDNRFVSNTMAISADNSSRIEMIGNVFKQNGYALRIMGNCMDNKIEKNDFIGNSFDVTTNSSRSYNSFNRNYWDEYTGYDLNRDGIGDVAHRPVKLFTYIIAQSPAAIILMRSIFIDLLNLAEKITPVITPDNLKDEEPKMRPCND